MRFLYAFLLAFCFLPAISQPTQYKIGKCLAVTFPSKPDSANQPEARVFFLSTDSLLFQALTQENINLEILDKKQFYSAMEGVYKGFVNKLPGFSLQKRDTSFGNTKGIFIYGKSKESTSNFKEIYAFCTVLNDHIYFVQTYCYFENPPQNLIENYFRSMRFTGLNYAEDGSIGYKIGYLLGMLIAIAAVVLAVLFIVKRFGKS